MKDPRINYVYWIAARMNKPVSYKKACNMSKKFSLMELEQMYRKVGRK